MWPNLQDTSDLVTFSEEILNGKLYFLCRVTFVRSRSIDAGLLEFLYTVGCLNRFFKL